MLIGYRRCIAEREDRDAIATSSEEQGGQGEWKANETDEEHREYGQRGSDSNGEETDQDFFGEKRFNTCGFEQIPAGFFGDIPEQY